MMVRSVDWPAFTEVQTDVYGHNTSVRETVALFTFTTYLEHLLVIFVTMALLNFLGNQKSTSYMLQIKPKISKLKMKFINLLPNLFRHKK